MTKPVHALFAIIPSVILVLLIAFVVFYPASNNENPPLLVLNDHAQRISASSAVTPPDGAGLR